MTPPLGVNILDTDPNLKAQPDPADSSESLLQQAKAPASELSVRTAVEHHAINCPAARKMRKYAMAICFSLGAIAASQWWIINSGKAWIRETVREALKEEREMHRKEGIAAKPAVGIGPIAAERMSL